MNTRSTLVSLVLLLAAAATVLAEEEVLSGGGALKALDKDGDGRVSRVEASAAATERANKRFDAIDADKDGYLTQEEVENARVKAKSDIRRAAEQRLGQADADGDGAISREEAKSLPMLDRNFERLDTNKDGKISRDEMPQGKRTGPPRGLPTT